MIYKLPKMPLDYFISIQKTIVEKVPTYFPILIIVRVFNVNILIKTIGSTILNVHETMTFTTIIV
jgi:hypothetical protein